MIYYKVGQVQIKDYILVAPAISSPVTLDDVKVSNRIDGSDFDDQILLLIDAATEYGESITGRDFITKTYKGFLNCFPASNTRSIEIRKSKLQSIVSIEYYKDGVLTVFDPSNYYTDQSTGFSKIYLHEGKYWESTDIRQQSIVITFKAGYGDDSCNVPSVIKRALLSHISLLLNNVGDCDQSGINQQALDLYRPYVLITKRFSAI